MLIILLALIDIHTLFVLIFASNLPPIYVFSGAIFSIAKGLVFYLPSRDIFSFLDMLIGLIMLFLLITPLWNIIFWPIVIYLLYKIIMSFSIIKL